MWVSFNCPSSLVDLFLLDSLVYTHINLKIYLVHEFVTYTSSQSGSEKWQLVSNLVQFTCTFSWSNPKFLWQLEQHEVRLKCLHTTRSVNLVQITRVFSFSLQIRGITSFFQVFCSVFFKKHSCLV